MESVENYFGHIKKPRKPITDSASFARLSV